MSAHTHYERRYARAHTGQVHVALAQPDVATKAPLLMLHQGPYSGAHYRPFQLAMAHDRLVICPDNPGYGMSDRPAAVPDIGVYARAMLEALDDLGIAGPVDLLGFHTGCPIAVELSLMAPARVRRMVLSGIPMLAEDQKAQRLARAARNRGYFTDPQALKAYFDLMGANRPPEVGEDRFLELFADAIRAGNFVGWGAVAAFSWDYGGKLPRIAHPTQVLLFNELLNAESAVAAPLIPGVQVQDFPAYGIWVFDQAPQDVLAAVRGFLS
jgi:pimeloyl-ACP methyl ester carboxylesterase